MADQPISGIYDLSFSGLWDISGSYSGPFLGATGVLAGNVFECTINENAAGKLSGTGSFSLSGNPTMRGTLTVGGSLETSSGEPIVTLTTVESGTGTITARNGRVDPASGSIRSRMIFSVDVADGVLVSKGGSAYSSGKDTRTGQRSSDLTSFQKGVKLALPQNAGDGFAMTLNLTQAGLKYTGTATIQTSTGVTTDMNVSGAYSDKKNTTSFTLKNKSGHFTMVVATSGDVMTINSLKGTLLGQILNYTTQ